MMSRRILPLILVALVPFVFGAKGKCRKDPPVEQTDTDVVPVPVPDVSEQLQVVSATPGTVAPATPMEMRVYGAGFASGAQVKIGSFRVADVKLIDPNTLQLTAPGLPEGTHDLTVINPNGREATLRGAVRAVQKVAVDESCSRMAMYFELDSASLSAPVRQALESALSCLKTRSRVRLEGHADERGTTDYNVALAQRRAESIQRYLVNQGIPPAKLPVVSFGEERPADRSHSESAWAKNRRVDMFAE